MAPRTKGRSKLKFSDKLVGKGHSSDALLKKIKALHNELAEMDQEAVDTSTLGGIRKELISTSILLHKDKGVKAYAACCMADLLRLYAPDAPYTGPELKDMFQFFLRQLSTGLKGTDSPYYNEYFYLLESLSSIKSVVLVCDLPHADELMTEIFRDFFDLVRSDLPKNVEMFISDILVALIEETASLPSDVLETIMAQFLSKNARVEQPAYRLAVDVCNATADRLQRNVCQYFTDIILQHTPSEDAELDEIRTAHQLIKELHKSCPALLLNVVPQLEEELKIEDLQLRLLATQVLGEMFADKGGGELAKKYPSTWTLWLARKNDKLAAVRIAFVEATEGLLKNHPQLQKDVEEALQTKLMDPDDKVRAAVCKVYSKIDYETAMHHVSDKQLRQVCERCLDKKGSVRTEALLAMGRLYSLAYPEIESNDLAAVKQFGWIPEKLFFYLTTSLEVKTMVEQTIEEYILPLPSKGEDEVAWTDRLLTVMHAMEEKSIQALLSLSCIKTHKPNIFEVFVQCCIDHNGGIIDKDEERITMRLSVVIQQLSHMFPDPAKVSEDLHSFAKLNEARLYKLLSTCIDPQTDLKTLVKSKNEFLRKIEQTSQSILETMTALVRRCSLWIINPSSVSTLVKRVQKGDHYTSTNAATVLSYLSKFNPAILKSHIAEFTRGVLEDKSTALVEVCLQALAALSRWEPGLSPNDKRTVEKVMHFVYEGNPRQAKFAARIIAYNKNKRTLCSNIVSTVTDDLPKAEGDTIVARLAVLAEMAKSAQDQFEQKSDVITTFLLKDTLLVPTEFREDDGMELDADWVEDHELSAAARAKVLSLKICTNRCLAQAKSESTLDIAAPVLKMLWTLLENSGSLTPNDNDILSVKSRLRLRAAVSLLRFATVPQFMEAVMVNFPLLAVTMQDTCFHVRLFFLTKLTNLLTAKKLDPRFIIILFLATHDPEHEIREKVRFMSAYITLRTLKVAHFEMMFIRLLHLLAHHPDFSNTPDNLQDIAKYIEFYLDIIASADNIPLLYHLALKAKTVRDSESHTYSENLYTISELAQLIIKARANLHSWSLPSYPGKVKLPSDIFKPLPNSDAANTILKTVYLPDETLNKLGKRVKPPTTAKVTFHPRRELVP
ncbi:hypothetical protein BOTBODRAFT_118968 [Botryobasidium botryosum FD-172 SS1]|uniref:Uncharacterized protein n=1 Tax=Botryobasidium botryosum (strain FD-172 SS1) TaxID=930990 RepID=A0A067M0I7_BOTB1|nr:hypothetical protein BOTBODRAFT_118968 [Botryobasidium botryosum FD-172 SS1]